MAKVFFGCDVHGSDLVFHKMLRMVKHHKVDVFMLCGDLTGKVIVPIVKRGPGDWYCAPWNTEKLIKSKEELEEVKKTFNDKGYYVHETVQQEVDDLKQSKDKQMGLFARLMKDKLKSWLFEAEQELPENMKIIISPGNDDSRDVDEVIEQSTRIIYPLERVVDLDGTHQLISCEWTNLSPWSTPRECSEEELKAKLDKEFVRVNDHKNVICNFHAPPFGTSLDIAPKLKDLKPVTRFGQPIMTHVGSTAVRDALNNYQPSVSLHGHIHESCAFQRLGRTLSLNPGSDYNMGVMRGYIVDLAPGKKPDFWRVEA